MEDAAVAVSAPLVLFTASAAVMGLRSRGFFKRSASRCYETFEQEEAAMTSKARGPSFPAALCDAASRHA